ncbi:MAG: RNA polymerase factor sigma-54 [bacterium]
MELGLRLSQKQTLKLVMTPRLQQALKLLQMPSLELSAHIEQELLTNPLLEIDETAEPSTPEPEAPESSEREVSPDDTELDSGRNDLDWSEYFDDGFAYQDGGRAEREETEFFERVPVGHATLADNLTEQLHLLDLDEETMRVAEYLIGCLDDQGFLAIPLEEVADELAIDVESALRALRRVQELEPAGIGARNLPECLLIQLRQRGEAAGLAAAVVEHHFEAFKQKHYQEIAKALKVEASDIQDVAHEIATLNPRPGAQLAREDARYVVPDLVVDKIDDQYVVSLADGSVPRLRVSRQYRDILVRSARNGEAESASGGTTAEGETPPAAAPASARAAAKEEEVKFVTEKLKSANWLIQTIEQRRRTMVKVMEAIVESQIDFFESGPQALKPLTLQDVAERIGMHESTVSRVTTSKYVQTPRGLFPLKYFFSSGLDTESGESVSSKMAMGRIRELIEKEDRKKPLSDQKIAELLRKEGLIVARRTVAKYRERMGILSARLRKEF